MMQMASTLLAVVYLLIEVYRRQKRALSRARHWQCWRPCISAVDEIYHMLGDERLATANDEWRPFEQGHCAAVVLLLEVIWKGIFVEPFLLLIKRVEPVTAFRVFCRRADNWRFRDDGLIERSLT